MCSAKSPPAPILPTQDISEFGVFAIPNPERQLPHRLTAVAYE
jgi:hypothetical protein